MNARCRGYRPLLCRSKHNKHSAADSKVKVLVIPTNEEIVIARDTLHLVTGK